MSVYVGIDIRSISLRIAAVGLGGRLAGSVLSGPFDNEFKAVAKGFERLEPDVRTVFEMGGENSKYIRLEHDTESGAIGIVDLQKNGDCAAGPLS